MKFNFRIAIISSVVMSVVAVSVVAATISKEEKLSAYNARSEELNQKLDEALYNESYGINIAVQSNEKRETYDEIRSQMIALNEAANEEGIFDAPVYTKDEIIAVVNSRISESKETISLFATSEEEISIQRREIELMELYVDSLKDDVRSNEEISAEYNETIAKMLAFDESTIPVELESRLIGK